MRKNILWFFSLLDENRDWKRIYAKVWLNRRIWNPETHFPSSCGCLGAPAGAGSWWQPISQLHFSRAHSFHIFSTIGWPCICFLHWEFCQTHPLSWENNFQPVTRYILTLKTEDPGHAQMANFPTGDSTQISKPRLKLGKVTDEMVPCTLGRKLSCTLMQFLT